MRAKPIFSIDSAQAAHEAAFDAHYDKNWINDLTTESAKELLGDVWEILKAFRDRDGSKYNDHNKVVDIRAMFNEYAEKLSQQFAEKHADNFAGES